MYYDKPIIVISYEFMTYRVLNYEPINGRAYVQYKMYTLYGEAITLGTASILYYNYIYKTLNNDNTANYK